MKVKIFDSESGEQLLEGDLNTAQVKHLLKTSLLKIQLTNYVSAYRPIQDYRDPLVGWVYDVEMDLWLRAYYLTDKPTFTAILQENVSLPAQSHFEREELLRAEQVASQF